MTQPLKSAEPWKAGTLAGAWKTTLSILVCIQLFVSCEGPNSSVNVYGKWRGCDSDSLRCYWFDFDKLNDKLRITIWQGDNGQVFEGSFVILKPMNIEGEELILQFAPLVRSDSIRYFEAQSYFLRDVTDSLIILYLPVEGQAFSEPIRLVPRW